MIRGKFEAQDDFDLAGHRLRNWKWLDDIPTENAVVGQAIVFTSNGVVWATLSSDGVVSVAWDDITGKPTEFPPEAHGHNWTEITGKPTEFPPEAHTHPVTEVTNAASPSNIDWSNATLALDSATFANGIRLNTDGTAAGDTDTPIGITIEDSAAADSVLGLREGTYPGWHTEQDFYVGANAGPTPPILQVGNPAGAVGRLGIGAGTIDFTPTVFTFGNDIAVFGDADITDTTTSARFVARKLIAGSDTLYDADYNVTYTAFNADNIVGVRSDIDVELGVGGVSLGSMRAFSSDIVLSSTGGFGLPVPHVFKSTMNLGGIGISNSPVEYVCTGAAASQQFAEGFFSVDVTGGSTAGSGNQTVAAFTRARVSGAATGVGYKGYALSAAGSTGDIIGVQGYVVSQGAGMSSEVALDTVILSSFTAADKRMGLRTDSHALVRDGSIICTSGSPATPNAVATSHMDFLNNVGEGYFEGSIEVDGELYADGNESHSLSAETATGTMSTNTYETVDASSAAVVRTLPAISGLQGRMYWIKKIDASANSVTLQGNGAETIDGANTAVITTQYDAITVIAGPTEWHIV